MNPKLLRIGLVLVALGVWGAVLVKAFFRRPVEVVETELAGPATMKAAVERPAPTPLDLHWERDPFLDGSASITAQRTSTSITAAQPPTNNTIKPNKSVAAVPAPSVNWPSIVYKGALNASGTPAKRVALLAIEGRDVVLRSGEQQNGIALVALEADSVVIRNGQELRSIRLQSTSSNTSVKRRSTDVH